MAPLTNSSLLSPAELSYLHQSLTYDPPVRPDNRKATQFRSVTAELDFLPSTYGSARVQLEDGTAAIVGIKADVEKTRDRIQSTRVFHEEEDSKVKAAIVSQDDWIEVNVNIPDSRDDDTLPIYLGQLILESLQSSGHLPSRCRINSRFHWKLYIDVSSLEQCQWKDAKVLRRCSFSLLHCHTLCPFYHWRLTLHFYLLDFLHLFLRVKKMCYVMTTGRHRRTSIRRMQTVRQDPRFHYS